MDAGPGPEPIPRLRRRTWLLGALVVVALLACVAAWLSRPQQVAGLVLHQAGRALGLEVAFDGAAEYRLRGTPQLMVRGLRVRQPGADVPLLTAHRAWLALPWSTLRTRGQDLAIDRIELDAPALDLPALQQWLASRPPGDGVRLPTLTRGIAITRGTVAGGNWTLRRLGLEVPDFHPGKRTHGHVTGELLAGNWRLPFDLHAVLAAPGPGAALGVAGNATFLTDAWSLPMQPVMSARLHAGEDGLGLDGMRLGMRARHVAPDREPLRFTAGLAAPLRYLDGQLEMPGLALVIRGDGTVPDLHGQGGLAWQDNLKLGLEGRLDGWPAAWPSLPGPLAFPDSPLPFALAYSGPADLSGPASLHLERDTTQLDATLRLPEVFDWLERQPAGSPLPPLQGRLATPRVEIAGATLHGVEVEVSAESDEP